MDKSVELELTAKGEEELKTRVNKLGMRARSLLLPLSKPLTVGQLLEKSVLRDNDFEIELLTLVVNGFIATRGDFGSSLAPGQEAEVADAQDNSAQSGAMPTLTENGINKDIVLSEAKFLLTDFCVDCFGTEADAYISSIRAVTSIYDFCACLTKVWSVVKSRYPGQTQRFTALIEEINATA